MEKQEKQMTNNIQNDDNSGYSIDVMRVLQLLLKRSWIIVVAGLLAAILGFYYSSTAISPTYSSYIKVYVNTSSVSLGSAKISISSSELNVAKDLVSTYREILKSRSTMERVSKKSDKGYTWKQIMDMVSCSSVNDTAIIRITVVCGDANDACIIANSIAEVLPERISEIIDGASMEIVDSAIVQPEKLGPNITRYTAIGFILGALLAAAIIVLLDVLDDTIHDEEYIIKAYDYPILGKIPDLLNTGNRSYSYYSHSNHKSKK